MRHLALAVRDQERSRRFSERSLGFDASPPRRYDGVLTLSDEAGFALALGRVEEPIAPPPFLHLGKAVTTPGDAEPKDAVDPGELCERLQALKERVAEDIREEEGAG